MLLKKIGLILLQNKILKELIKKNQNSFTHELYSMGIHLGFSWILCLRWRYKYNIIITFRSGRVTKNWPKYRPYCGKGDQSYIHWIFECSAFFEY